MDEPNLSKEQSLDEPSPEFLQKKLYFLIENLKNYHAKLPLNVQMKIPYELLVELANSLLNDTMFEIIKGLLELQNVTEKYLYQERESRVNEHKLELQEWGEKIDDKEELDHITELMKLKHDKELKEIDKKAIQILDQKVRDQQCVLQQAGIAGFKPTDNPKEIIVQMHLLDFILRLSKLNFGENK